MGNATLYTINETEQLNQLIITDEGTVSLANSYSSIFTISINNTQLLIGYNSDSGDVDSYELTASSPWVKPVANELSFGTGWDHIEPFYLMNQPYVCCYQATSGKMYFFPVTDEIKTEPPLHFYHTRYPYTTDLTEVKALVSQGQVFILGYNNENGYVNIWTVSATSRSDGNNPPIVVNSVWAHQWAKGWNRFAFFTWGNENFFLKTNTWKPNVNIDHISDVLSSGTNEVGSHLDLKDDQLLNIVRPFMVGNGEPYFLTYRAETGESTFNRIHGNCLGWNTCATTACVKDASHIVNYRIDETNYALYV